MWPWSSTPAVAVADGHQKLHMRHVRLQPTRLGWGLSIVCVLLWLMAVNYQINVAYVLVFWLFGVLLFGWLLSIRQLLGLSLQVVPKDTYFAGKPVVLNVRVPADNKQHRWLWLHWRTSQPEAAGDWQFLSAQPHTAASCHWTLPPQPRGLLLLPEFGCMSAAPFGLLVVKSHWHYNGEVVIYPAPIAHELPAITRDEAAHNVHTSQSGEDLAYLLPHQNSTSLRQIAWKQYAKTGQLLDKQFDTGQRQVASQVISFRDYPPNTGKERLAGLLCYRVLQAEQQQQSFVLELPHQRIEPGVGQIAQCLTALGLW